MVDYFANSHRKKDWLYSCDLILYIGLYFVTKIISVKTKSLKRV